MEIIAALLVGAVMLVCSSQISEMLMQIRDILDNIRYILKDMREEK